MSTPQALQDFANWVATIRGDEVCEAQTYVNRLLQAWGWADAVEAGTTFERRIPKGSLAGGMGKADALLSNFDQIWVYDFNQLVDEPLVRLQVADLASQASSLAFLSKSEQPVHFGLNQIAVTEAQARSMAELFARSAHG